VTFALANTETRSPRSRSAISSFTGDDGTVTLTRRRAPSWAGVYQLSIIPPASSEECLCFFSPEGSCPPQSIVALSLGCCVALVV